MGLTEKAYASALEELDTIIALVRKNPQYRPAGLWAGLHILRGLLRSGVTPAYEQLLRECFAIMEVDVDGSD